MSFFDEDDETRVRSSRPRRPAASGAVVADQQTLLIRRAVALGAGLLLLIALFLLVRSCQSSRAKDALRDYSNQVSSLVQESDAQVGTRFFDLMNEGARESANDLQVQINQLRVAAENQYKRAEKLSVPDAMAAAQRSLLIELEFRKDGLDYIAKKIKGVKATEDSVRERAIEQIAGQMQAFLASDVIHAQRVVPLMQKALKDGEVVGIEPAKSRFLRGIEWLSPRTVSDKLGADVSSSETDPNAPPAPGLHGTGLVSVAYGDKVLQAGGSNILKYDAATTFSVKFANQGENDESDVKVVLRIEASGGGGKPVRASKTVDFVGKGTEATAVLALPDPPPTGDVAEINVEIQAVPGEKKTDNNKGKYAALFQK